MLGAIGMDMSDGGDIWSTGIFSYESPLKDLLDSGNYSLEDLLAEDELLQELRSNEMLQAYFADKQVVRKLIEIVVQREEPALDDELPPLASAAAATTTTPAPNGEKKDEIPLMNGMHSTVPDAAVEEAVKKEPGAWLMEHIEHIKTGKVDKSKKLDPMFRKIRFPYMACEVICSEVPKVLELLAEPDLLDALFSLIVETTPADLDDYQAGYFDKIMNVLFRRKPDEVSLYINDGTFIDTCNNCSSSINNKMYSKTQLMEALIRHLSSHSIMQITQQLLMPERPRPEDAEGASSDDNNNSEQQQGDKILDGEEDDIMDKQVRCDWFDPKILDLLLDTLLSENITTALNASEVITAVVQNSMLSAPIVLSLCSEATTVRLIEAAVQLDTFSRHECRNTIAMNVLENVILQLGGYGSVGTVTLVDNDEPVQDIADLRAISAHLHHLLDGFTALLTHPKTKEWTSPTQFSKGIPQQLLGTSRLRIVRVVESLILLGDPSIDSIIVEQSRCLECCLNFFWEFQWCSMLHQSVANLLVHVFEGQNVRYEMQQFLLVKCDLMKRLMDSFVSDKTTDGPPAQTFRYGYMGHVIIICQALVHAYSPNEEEDDAELNPYDDPQNQQLQGGDLAATKVQASATAESSSPDGSQEPAAELGGTRSEDTANQSTDDGIPRDDFGEPLLLFELVFRHEAAERWLDFVDTVLAADNAMQVAPLGGYPVQAPSMIHRPGLIDEGFMMGDDGDGPPAPPSRLSEVLEMDDNDLDVAVSMMDELNMREEASSGSGSSGDTATDQRPPYVFDDPLGKAGTLGLELNKLQQLNTKLSSSFGKEKDENDDDDSDGGSSSEEPESQAPEVPVLDLFTGNFNYDEALPAADDFADFANFETIGRGGGPDTDNDFGPFATAEEKNKLDEIFGEGDHAELLEDDDFETNHPLSTTADYPFQNFGDATESADRIFDENETIASLADAAIQQSPRPEDKERTTNVFTADSVPMAVSLPIGEVAAHYFVDPSDEASPHEIRQGETLPRIPQSDEWAITSAPVDKQDAAAANGATESFENGETPAPEVEAPAVQDHEPAGAASAETDTSS